MIVYRLTAIGTSRRGARFGFQSRDEFLDIDRADKEAAPFLRRCIAQFSRDHPGDAIPEELSLVKIKEVQVI